MPFNGLGAFSLIYDWIQDRNNGIKILASRMMGQEQDIADGLSQCVTVDGQSTITNTMPFGNQQITLLAAATTLLGAPNLGQVQGGSANYASASGTYQYVAALDPAPIGIPDGMTVNIYFPNTNATAATATFNLNGLGAWNIVDPSGDLIPRNAVNVGVAQLVSRGSSWFYNTPSTAKGLYNLIDGGALAFGSTVQFGTIYSINAISTSGTINVATAATGDSFGLIKYGTGTMRMNLGSQLYNGSSAPLSTNAEGISIMRYTGAARGFVEG